MDDLDKKIFSGSDNPFDAKDDVFEMLENWIEKRILGMGDRCEVMHVQVDIAMLYRLSSYFSNTTTKRTDAMLWKHQVLAFFDAETKNRGDAEAFKGWREEIEANFDRLISVLEV